MKGLLTLQVAKTCSKKTSYADEETSAGTNARSPNGHCHLRAV